jgi:hypothetical protein
MSKDHLRLLKFGLLTVMMLVFWFALALLSSNLIVQLILGWVGFGMFVLSWRWLLKNKVQPPGE